MSIRVITLTGRPSVKIDEDKWPLIASANDAQHDGKMECQANRNSAWFIGVRRHADGRAIVYAIYHYDSAYQNERDLRIRRGALLGADSTMKDVCCAISEVSADIATAEHAGDDANRWQTLRHECVADLPAEQL
jgi:hypothetical protein